jgi:hypothetical protein
MTRRAVPAPPKVHSRQGPDKDDVQHGTPKGRILEKRRQERPKRNNGIRDRGLRPDQGDIL